MSLPWFRLYSEFLSDPLIRLLSFEDQRHFIAALCMKCSGVTDKRYATVTVRKNVISSLIGLSSEAGAGGSSALDLANERLRALGLIDEEWHPTNWDKRQFQSDHVDRTAAERMRRYRSKRNVTDVTTVVTATDTDTDTDIRTTLSGTPDVIAPKNIKPSFKEEARQVLSFLNEKACRNYQPVAANMIIIESRFREGATLAQCRQVIAKKYREWGSDEKMSVYLRPATLFNKTKFAQYVGELVLSPEVT